MKITLVRMVLMIPLATAAPLLGAPAAEAPAAPRATAAQPADLFRFEISTMRARVGLALEKLQGLQKDGADLPVLFKDYRDEVVEMAALAKKIAARAQEMKKADLAFFRAWEAQVDTIQDADVQKLAKDRYDRRVRSYRRMVTSMDEARNSFFPFLTSLEDLEKLLVNDLKRSTIQSAHKFFRATSLKGTDLLNDLYDVLIEEGRICDEFVRYQGLIHVVSDPPMR